MKAAFVLGFAALALAACGPNAAEKAGEKADSALAKMGDSDALEKAGEKVDSVAAVVKQDAVKAGDTLKADAEKAKADLKKAADDAKKNP